MFGQNFTCLFLQFIILIANSIDANPLIGKKVLPATKDEFPFIVSLSHTCNVVDNINHFCGGSLISKKHVLTSAHCILDDDPRCVSIITRTINFESGEIYDIDSWITYDAWAGEHNATSGFSENDIAIITLSKEVKNIVPALISKLKYEYVVGKQVVTAGWGYSDIAKLSRPESLRKAYLKILSREEHERNEMNMFGSVECFTFNKYFTAAVPPAVLTSGDSGGPLILVMNKKIVGVNDAACSVKNPQNNPNAQSLHVAVDFYREFIESVIKSDPKNCLLPSFSKTKNRYVGVDYITMVLDDSLLE